MKSDVSWEEGGERLAGPLIMSTHWPRTGLGGPGGCKYPCRTASCTEEDWRIASRLEPFTRRSEPGLRNGSRPASTAGKEASAVRSVRDLPDMVAVLLCSLALTLASAIVEAGTEFE